MVNGTICGAHVLIMFGGNICKFFPGRRAGVVKMGGKMLRKFSRSFKVNGIPSAIIDHAMIACLRDLLGDTGLKEK